MQVRTSKFGIFWIRSMTTTTIGEAKCSFSAGRGEGPNFKEANFRLFGSSEPSDALAESVVFFLARAVWPKNTLKTF